MNKTFAKTMTAALLLFVLIPAVCSCSFFKKNKVITAATEFGDALRFGDSSEILKKTDGLEREYKQQIKQYFKVDSYSEESKYYFAHMMDSLVIEVDGSSVEVSKTDASVDMSFTIADQTTLMDGDYKDINALCDAIDKCATRTIDITVEFTEIDKVWYVTNFDDEGFQDLLSFFTAPMPPIAKGTLIANAKAVAESVTKDDPSLSVNVAASVKTPDMIDIPEYVADLFDYGNTPSEEDKVFRDAVLASMTYEVDESSLVIEGQSGSIDISITMPDYEQIAGKEFKKIDDISTAVQECAPVTYTFHAAFVRNGPNWYITNLDSPEYAEFLKYKDFSVTLKSIDGTYTATVDITDKFIAYITKEFNVNMPSDLEGRIYINATLELKKGNYEVTIDRDAFVGSIKAFVETNIDKILMNTLGTTSSVALDTLAKLAGYKNYADMRAQILSQVTSTLETIDTSALESSGTYSLNDDTVTFKSATDTMTGKIDNFGVITVTAPVKDEDAKKLLGSDKITLPFKKA